MADYTYVVILFALHELLHEPCVVTCLPRALIGCVCVLLWLSRLTNIACLLQCSCIVLSVGRLPARC